MKRKFYAISGVLCSLLVLVTLVTGRAQTTRVVSGTVSDEKGDPLPGVTVLLKGASGQADVHTGTATDAEGRFSLTVPAEGGTLVFSFIGLATKEIPIPETGEMAVTLSEDITTLNEIVVTALGIEREEKSLGYGVSKIEGEAISSTSPNNWLNGLAGKVPGLTITSAGAGPGGSVRVVLRGQNSLDMSKGEALFVIDGVPVTSGGAGNGNVAYNPSGDPSMDYGNAISEINPDDIESVTVLRGPAAAALYGSSAGAGAILITTKSGSSSRDRISISLDSDISFHTVLRWPDYQYEYGEGQRNMGAHTYYSYGSSPDGPNTRSTHTWGPPFKGQMFYQYDPVTQKQGTERTPWVADKGYVKDFFRTGVTYTNTLSLEGGNERNRFRFSATNLQNKYIVPNTGYSRNTIALSSRHKLNDLNITTKINYYNRKSDNLPSAGYSARSVAYSMLWTAPNIPVDWYRNYWRIGMEDIEQNSFYNSGDDNPFFSVYEQLNTMDRHRVFGNVTAEYKIGDRITITGRSGIDFGNRFNTTRRPFSSVSAVSGEYREQQRRDLKLEHNLLVRYQQNLNEDIEFSVSAGVNSVTSEWKNDTWQAPRLNYPGLYTLANSRDPIVARSALYRKVVNSVYGMGQISYKSMVFLDVTGRNDWSSTLPVGNNSFFYPSVSLSAVLSDILNMSSMGPISFAKLRASIAQVGNDTDPYQTARYYESSAIGGSYSNPTVLPNLELKPEMVTSREIGLDIRFLNGNLGLDITYYNSDSKNQILEIPTDPSTGFQYRAFNAGQINNKGWELALNAKPIKSRNGFNWSVNALWSKNINTVVELAPGVESIVLSRGPRGFVQATVGGSLGDIYGGGLLRNEEGQVIYDAQGYPILDQELRYQGSALPDWKASFGSRFTYRNWSLNFLFDGTMGGKIYSLTHSMLAYSGKLRKTLPGRYNGLIGEGVQMEPDGTYRPNDVVTEEISLYYNALYQRDNVEMNTFDASFVKLREVTLQYKLPEKLVRRTKFLKSASVAVYGHDLLLFTKFPAFDPEIGTLNEDRIEIGFETGQLPSTRTMGANIKVTF